jgi:fatty acid CoA ligase FadD9
MYVDGRSVWLSGGTLESIFGKLPQIHQIFIHGQRTEDSLLAIIVPKIEFLQVDEKKLKSDLLLEFAKLGKDMQNFEIPKGIVLEKNEWTAENGMITATGKLCRGKIQQKYKLQIDVEYTNLSSH